MYICMNAMLVFEGKWEMLSVSAAAWSSTLQLTEAAAQLAFRWISIVPFSGARLFKTHRWRPAVQGDDLDADGWAAQQEQQNEHILLLGLCHSGAGALHI